MPAGDMTGPERQGPMTGRGRGLEDVVKAAEAPKTPPTPTAAGKSIFDAIGGPIDDLVSTVKSLPSRIKQGVKSAAYYTYYTTKAGLGLAAGLAIAGTAQALIFPVGMALGGIGADLKNKEKTTFKKIANELAIGGLLGGILHYMFAGVTYLGNMVKSAYGKAAGLVTKGALGFATVPPFLASHEYLNRALISDYKPQPLEIGKKIKGPLKWIMLPVIANFSIVPEYLGHTYQMPIAAGISTAYGLLKGDKKEEKPQLENNKEPQTLKFPQQPYNLPQRIAA